MDFGVESSVLPDTGWPSLAVALAGSAIRAAERRDGKGSLLAHAVASRLPAPCVSATWGAPMTERLGAPFLTPAERDRLFAEAERVTSAAVADCLGIETADGHSDTDAYYDNIDDDGGNNGNGRHERRSKRRPHSTAALWDNPAWALFDAHVRVRAYDTAFDAAEKGAARFLDSLAEGGMRTRRARAAIEKVQENTEGKDDGGGSIVDRTGGASSRRVARFEAREAALWTCDLRAKPSHHVREALGSAIAAAGDGWPMLSPAGRGLDHGPRMDIPGDDSSKNNSNSNNGDEKNGRGGGIFYGAADPDDDDDAFDHGMMENLGRVGGTSSSSSSTAVSELGAIPREWHHLSGILLPRSLRSAVWRAAYGRPGARYVGPGAAARAGNGTSGHAGLDDTHSEGLVERVLGRGVAAACLARDTPLGDPGATHGRGGARPGFPATGAGGFVEPVSGDGNNDDGGRDGAPRAGARSGAGELSACEAMYRWERSVAARAASLACSALGGFSARIVALAAIAVVAGRPGDWEDSAVMYRWRVPADGDPGDAAHPFRDAWRLGRGDPRACALSAARLAAGMSRALPSGEAAVVMAEAVLRDVLELDPDLHLALSLVPTSGPASVYTPWDGGVRAVIAGWIECGFAGRLRPEAACYALDSCAVIGTHALADIALAVLLVSSAPIVRARNIRSSLAGSSAGAATVGAAVGEAVCAAPGSLLTAEIVRAHNAIVHAALMGLDPPDARALVRGDTANGRPDPDGMIGAEGLGGVIERVRRLAFKRTTHLENAAREAADARAVRALAEHGFNI